MNRSNRSQSSYRICKTLQSEEPNQMSWMGNMNPRRKNQQDKQNDSLFQSVSERAFHPQQKQTKSKDSFFKLKCIDYQKQICKLNKEKQNLKFNYSEQYYLRQINELKNLLKMKDEELKNSQIMQGSKTSQISSEYSSSISSKIQKTQQDKNLYIKQLNNKDIELVKLNDLVKLYKSEKQTQLIHLRDKEDRIKQLEQRLSQVDMKKKKIESYEAQIRQRQDFLNQLEAQTRQLKRSSQQKQMILRQKTESILELEQTNNYYQEKVKQFENSFTAIKKQRDDQKQKLEEMLKENQRQEKNNKQLKLLKEKVREFQMKTKNYQSICQDLNRRNLELVNSQQKSKSKQTSLEKSLLKYQQLDKQNNQNKMILREKVQLLQFFETRQKSYQELEANSSKVKREKEDLIIRLNEKTKQIKILLLNIEELNHKNEALAQEMQDIIGNQSRIKQRNEKIDTIVKENSRLTEEMELKINEIQKLQHKQINNENRMVTLTAEIKKYNMAVQQAQQNIMKKEIEINSLRQSYQKESKQRKLMEEKFIKSNQENVNLKGTILRLQQQNENLENKLQNEMNTHKQDIENVKNKLLDMQDTKNQYEDMLTENNCKIDTMRVQVNSTKEFILQLTVKQKNHLHNISMLEEKLSELHSENKKLEALNKELQTGALKVREMANAMLCLKYENQ